MFTLRVPPATPEELRQLIEQYFNITQFTEGVEKVYSKQSEVDAILHAHQFFSDVSKYQRRQSGGSVMNNHLMPVANLGMHYWLIEDMILTIAALGHDSVEDTGLTREDVIHEFTPIIGRRDAGKVAHTICGATKIRSPKFAPKTVEFEKATFMKAVQYGLRSQVLKFLMDRLHNMLTLWGTPEKKKAKVIETKRLVLPIMEIIHFPTNEMEVAIKEQETLLHIDDTVN